MPTVSWEEYKGYQVDALWDFGMGEPPRFVVRVTDPQGKELGEWAVEAGPGTSPHIGEAQALDFGIEQAKLDLEAGGEKGAGGVERPGLT